MPRRGQGRITGQPVTTEIPLPAGGVKLTTFIPWTLVKRGMKKEIITPLDAPEAFREEAEAERQLKKAKQPRPLLRALGLAHYWQQLLDEGKYRSITEIAQAEGLNRGYVTRLMLLCRLAPEIIDTCLADDTNITLETLMGPGLPSCWRKQREKLEESAN